MSRVVVVDDHPVFRKGLVALLRAEGHEVVAEAADGAEAVAVVAAEHPDVVLMDLSMPLRDGFDATAQITARHPDTKVVVITLFEDEASVVQALEAGASGYVRSRPNPTRSRVPSTPCSGGRCGSAPEWPGPRSPPPRPLPFPASPHARRSSPISSAGG